MPLIPNADTAARRGAGWSGQGNAAGISWAAPAERMPLEKWKAVMDVNATGAFLMCQAVGQAMIAAGGGKIVNIASVAGLVGSSPRVLDAAGYALPYGGAALAAVVSLGGAPRLREAAVVAATDVDSPLLGLRGASAVYGPQKGATRPDVFRALYSGNHSSSAWMSVAAWTSGLR